MRQLYSSISQAIYPIVVEVLNEYEYDGSPVYSYEIDRETIAQLVDRVISRGNEILDDVQETILDENNNFESYSMDWNRENLLKSIVESLLLNEIFIIRRPYYRQVRNNYRNNYNNSVNPYPSNMYSPINY